MVSDKDKCFRLRGIPWSFDKAEIQSILAAEFSLGGNGSIEVYSLASHPVRQGERIATLSFLEIPASLFGQPNYFIDIPGSRRQLHLDTHFEGFTPLHETPDDRCELDIVAISGLNGHAFGSFKQDGRRRMWLRDDLPSDFAQARIFIYGYDTSPDQEGFQNILDIADTFRKTLAILRQSSRQRPLVFIAHSFGGIIVKASLNAMADSQDEQDKSNLSFLRALFFFGVPNQGMNIESLLEMNHDIVRRRIIYPLDKQNSAELRTISKEFIRRFKDTVTVNFYETLKSPTAELEFDGSWSMTGIDEMLVSTDSATQGRVFDDGVNFVFQVHRTHRNMVKLNGVHDNVYEHFCQRLKEVMKDLGRGPSPSTEDQKACLQSLWFSEQHDRQSQAIDPAEGTCSWILKNPIFQAWHNSHTNLLWILGPPGSGKSTLMKYLFEWKNSQRQGEEVLAAFFVHGRGKSKLQYDLLGLYRALLHQIFQQFPKHLEDLARKYMTYEKARGKHGTSWNWSEQELRKSFFDILIKESPRRPVTVLIDALDEIGSTQTDPISIPVREFIAALRRFTDDHTLDPLGGKLKVLISCRYYPVIYDDSGFSILIEKENQQDIATFIESHPTLNDMRGENESLKRTIVMRANGIFQWVAVVLEEVTRLHNKGMSFMTIKRTIERVPDKLQDLYQSLILSGDFDERKLALRLFTWLIFAARPLSLAEFRDALAVDARMEHTSFARLSESKDSFDLNAMGKVVTDLSRGLVQVQRSDRAKNSVFGAGFFRSKDTRLDDPVYDGGWHTLQLMHQSVLDYLKIEGLNRLAASIKKTGFNAHWELSRSCIKYLLLEEIVDKPFYSEDSASVQEIEIPLTFEFALTEYAHSFWLLHVMKAEEDNVDQQDLLEISALEGRDGYLPQSCNLRSSELGSPFLGLKNNIHLVFAAHRTLVQRVDNLYQFWNDRYPAINTDLMEALVRRPVRLTLLELLLIAGIRIVVPYMQELDFGWFEWERTPFLLQYALLGRHQAAIDWILKNLSRDHLQRLLHPEVDPALYSPLAIATVQGDQKLIQQLLDAGAKVDAGSGNRKSQGSYTALGLAVQQRNSAVVEILLDAGADRMKKTAFDKLELTKIGTPHVAAETLGHDDVRLLLEQHRHQKRSQYYGCCTI